MVITAIRLDSKQNSTLRAGLEKRGVLSPKSYGTRWTCILISR
jgi:hypothetical protein